MNKNDCLLFNSRDPEVRRKFFRELYIHKPELKEQPSYKQHLVHHKGTEEQYGVRIRLLIQHYEPFPIIIFYELRLMYQGA